VRVHHEYARDKVKNDHGNTPPSGQLKERAKGDEVEEKSQCISPCLLGELYMKN